MTSRYHLYCDVFPTSMSESHLQADEEEEDEGYENAALVTIQIRRWKIQRSAVELTAVGSSERDFELQDVVERNGELIREVTARLTELGIAEAGHGTMIDELVEYIDEVVIQRLCGLPVRVCMDVVEAVEIEESHVAEAVRRSIITYYAVSELSWLTVFDMDLEEEEESESAEDDLEEAARLSMEMMDAVNTTPPLSKADVAGMFEGLQQVEGEAEEGEAFLCVICMEGKCDDESGGFKQMPCNHVLHATCANTWFRISPSCPLCRFRLKIKS